MLPLDFVMFASCRKVSSPHSTSTDLTDSSLPGKAVFKKPEQEEDMLALFGFTKVGGRPTVPKVGDKPVVKPKSFAKFGKADMAESSHHINNEKIAVRLSQVRHLLSRYLMFVSFFVTVLQCSVSVFTSVMLRYYHARSI